MLTKHLANYENTFVAFCELINNSLQANSTEIKINIIEQENQISGMPPVKEIIIRDNGVGVNKTDFLNKIFSVASETKKDGKGVGRFSAFQLGQKFEIETVSFDNEDNCSFKSFLILSKFEIDKLESIENAEFDVEHQQLEQKTDSFYQVRITGFYDPSNLSKNDKHLIHKSFNENNFPSAIFDAYPDQVFNETVKFIYNDKIIDKNDFIIGEPDAIDEVIKDMKGDDYKIKLTFIKLKRIDEHHKVFLRIKNNEIFSIAATFNLKIDLPENHQWYIYIDSEYFDSHVDFNRRIDLGDLDVEMKFVINEISKRIDSYFNSKYENYRDFLKKLTSDKYYPYLSENSSSESKTSAFSKIAYHIEDEYEILKKDNKIRKIIYPLVDKAINDGNFISILSSIIPLKDDLVCKLKDLSEKSDIESVIKFSHDVSTKLQFLDFLHQLVYGNIAKIIKERTQLHKIIEKQLWIFGEKYNNTPYLFSDKNLENTLISIRNDIFKFEVNTDETDHIDNSITEEKVLNIADLVFLNEKIIDDNRREIMVVELKAPRVRISLNELRQAEKYALQIIDKGVFSTDYYYKIILISSDLTKSAKTSMPKNSVVYKSYDDGNVEIIVLRWSDIIKKNRDILSYMGNLLKTKDISVMEIFEKEYSELGLQQITSKFM